MPAPEGGGGIPERTLPWDPKSSLYALETPPNPQNTEPTLGPQIHSNLPIPAILGVPSEPPKPQGAQTSPLKSQPPPTWFGIPPVLGSSQPSFSPDVLVLSLVGNIFVTEPSKKVNKLWTDWKIALTKAHSLMTL